MRKPTYKYTKAETWLMVIVVLSYIWLCLPVLDFYPEEYCFTTASTILLLLPVALVLTAIFVSYGYGKRYFKKFAAQTIEQGNNMMVSRLENCEKDFEATKKKLLSIMRITDGIGAFFILFAYSFPIACVIAKDIRAHVIGFLPCYFILCLGFARIRLKPAKKTRPLYDNVLKKDEYPAIYSLTEKAAKAVGATEKISVFSMTGNNISIISYPDANYIYIGSTTLQLLNEDELYAALLHEFAHAKFDKDKTLQKLSAYSSFILSHSMGNAMMFALATLDCKFSIEYAIFTSVSSVYIEKQADKAMKLANAEAAASMLLKCRYYNANEFETLFGDEESFLKSETQPEDFLSRELEKFKTAMGARAESWNNLIRIELQPRNSTHPITRTRLENLGVCEYKILDCSGDSDEYRSEKDRLFALSEKEVFGSHEDNYADLRKSNYLAPLEEIQAWEDGGRELTPDGYRNIIEAFFALARYSEAIEVAKQAIEQFDEPAAAYATFTLGNYLVHKYDKAGVDLLWKALEINENYNDAALDLIAQFACFTGDEELLEEYRNRSIRIHQNEKDYGVDLGIMKKGDNFTAEQLPEGQLEKDLSFMIKAGGESIETIYLVRKTIGEHFRSQYVVKFVKGTENSEINRIMDAIFNYLDTVSDWPYALFYYELVKRSKFYRTKGCVVYDKSKK